MKNTILKIICTACVTTQILGVCAMDTPSIIPSLMILIPFIFTIPFGIANGYFNREEN